MSPKKPNDFFDLSEFDDLLNRPRSSGKLEYDSFDLELDDYQISIPEERTHEIRQEDAVREEKTVGKEEAVREDEDLDSFLKFYTAESHKDRPAEAAAEAVSEPEPEPEPKTEPAPEPEPEPVLTAEEEESPVEAESAFPEEPDGVSDEEPQLREGFFSRLRRKPAEEQEREEEVGDFGEDADLSEPDGVSDEEPRPREGFFARLHRKPAEEQEWEEEVGDFGEDPDLSEPEEGSEEDRPRFSLRNLFARFVTDEEDETEEDPEEESDEEPEADPEEEMAERPRFSLASLFRRRDESPDDEDAKDEPTEELSEPAEETDAEESSEDAEDGARLPLFAGLFSRKNKYDAIPEKSDAKASEPPEQERAAELSEQGGAEETAPNRALREIRSAELTTSADIQRLPRAPKAGEMLVYDSELDEIDYIDEQDLPELRDYMPVRFSRHGRSGIGGGIMYALFVICISVVLACAGWLFASDVLALNKPDTTAIVTILPYVPTEEDTLNEDGDPVDENGYVITADVDQVASALKSAGVIDFKWLFKIFTELSSADVKIDPGTYDVSAKLDYRALVTEMQTGSDSQEITRITFPEGYTMEQIFQLLEDNGICDKDELYDIAANYDFGYDWLEDIPLGEASRLEGYLFPDTYDFYQGESAINAINRFLLRFHYILTMDMYTQAENLGITIHEAVIIASLIEEEAGAEDNRAYFASVIYNRLNAGWKLQLDSTVNYVMGTSTLNISTANTQIDHPYNTYVYEGLPPGPISNPGKASLEAALNPASTNYWFWYAYEGKTTFFSNSSDFNAFADSHSIS